jgi:tripartite-type tricarboxylate transporter receptor subunit TctC
MKGIVIRADNLRFAAAAIALGLAPFGTAAPASAGDAAEFYKDRQISWILSTGAGGGYAAAANAFAPYFSAKIPGSPRIVIQTMPGGGGLRAMQHLSTMAAKDGSVIGLVHSGVPLAPLFGFKGANFDPRSFGWIGSLNDAVALCVAWSAAGIRTAADLYTKEFVVGGTGAGSQMETYPRALANLLGMRIKIISGYKSGNDVYLAMERGEVAGRCGGGFTSINATRPNWLPTGKAVVPLLFAFKRIRELPDVPVVMELAKDDRTRRILALMMVPQQMDRPLLVPPGVPGDRLAVLRKAFHAAINDAAFIAEAAKRRVEISEVSGERLESIIAEAYATPPDIVAAVRQATGGGP